MKKAPRSSSRSLATIYLDYNATTPVDPEAREAMARALERWGNPSSSHAIGLRAREVVEEARAEVAGLLGARDDEIVFTSGGSESNNLAIQGAARARRLGHLVTCEGEHPAVLEVAAFLEGEGFAVTRLPIDRQGRVAPEAVRKALRPDTILVSVMHANNETGTIQPIEAIGRILRERGVLFHTDAAQSVGKIPALVEDLQVDLLTVAGHKLYGPQGVGALYVRRGVKLWPLVRGASQEAGLRAGTEAVHQVAGLGAASRVAARELDRQGTRLRAMRDRLWETLREAIPGLTLNGHPDLRLPGTLNVNFPGVWGADLLAASRRVAASTGSACHGAASSSEEDAEARLSPVLRAMGVPPAVGSGAVRLSLGRPTSEEEVKAAAAALIEAHARLAFERPLR